MNNKKLMYRSISYFIELWITSQLQNLWVGVGVFGNISTSGKYYFAYEA